MQWKFVKGLLASLIIVFTSGCVSIPPEAPELSQELGKRISALESANMGLVNKFFDLKRAEVDRFMNEKWLPRFAEKFFDDPNIKIAWGTVVKEDDKAQRLKFLTVVGPKLVNELNKTRRELIAPIDELERTIEQAIRAQYTQAKAINNSLTSFLLSAAKVKSAQSRYLELVGLSDAHISSAITEADKLVSNVLGAIDKAEDASDKIDGYKQKFDELKSKFE